MSIDEERKARRRAAAARWHANNPDRLRANAAKWSAANPDKARAAVAKWRAANPDKMRASTAMRRGRTPSWVTMQTLVPYYRLAQTLTLCGEPHVVDHFVPLSKGGLNVPANLHVIPAAVNASKGDKMPEKFYGERYPEVLAAMRHQQENILA